MKKMGELTVGDYMSRGAITIDDSEKVITAIRKMEENKLSVVPAVDGQGKIVGILSSTDLIEMIYVVQSELSALPLVSEKMQKRLLRLLTERGDTSYVRDVMKSPVETIVESANLVVAARKMDDSGYHHLPVVDENDRPIGMLSTSDFVRAFARQAGLVAG